MTKHWIKAFGTREAAERAAQHDPAYVVRRRGDQYIVWDTQSDHIVEFEVNR